MSENWTGQIKINITSGDALYSKKEFDLLIQPFQYTILASEL